MKILSALRQAAGKNKPHFIWLLLLAVLAAIPMASELFSTTRVLSEGSTDITLHFLFSRAFGFGEIARGNLPLWNPYIYGGIPYLGQFQSALLYPLNLIFLFPPLPLAINWSFYLHIFLLGAGMYAWALWRNLLRPAAFVAGVAAMFSGTVLLHIFAGHLSNVCSLAWIPLVFAGIDQWLRHRQLGWIFLSSAAAALQVYAGHPQYVYYTALVAGLYSLVHLIGVPRPISAAAGLAAIYPLAALLAAAQLIPGVLATSEAVRSGGVAYEFSAMFSFPPENFLTLFAPWVFGDMRAAPYWGRCYLWEMSFFAGIGTFVLACFGSMRKPERGNRWPLLAALLCVVILALGMHTPLHKFLYNVLPGFSSFRGSSKFIIFAGLFIAMFAGFGMDRLLRGQKFPTALAGVIILLGVVLAGASWTVSSEKILHWFDLVQQSRESYLRPDAMLNDSILRSAVAAASNSLLVAGACLIGFATMALVANRWKPAAWVIAVAMVGELLVFARSTIASFPFKDFTYAQLADSFQKNPGDYRVLNMLNPDSAMMLRKENIWGYDPGVLKRYAQLLYASQGLDPEQAGQYLAFRSMHPILSLLRGEYIIAPNGAVQRLGDPFPRFFFVSRYKVIPDATARLAELKSSWFDLKDEVILEKEPNPAPSGSTARGEIRVLDSNTDSWTFEVTNDRPTILVMTDSYSRDWHATALEGSTQTSYEILPADHAIRAIPLAAGTHRIRITYSPSGFGAGLLISTLTIATLGVTLFWPPARRRLDLSASPV